MIHEKANLKTLLQAKKKIEEKIPNSSFLKLGIAKHAMNLSTDPKIMQEIMLMLESILHMETREDLIVQAKTLLAPLYRRLDVKLGKSAKHLKGCLENHYGRLPEIVDFLMALFRNDSKKKSFFEKCEKLLVLAEEVLVSGNYDPTQNMDSFYGSAFSLYFRYYPW
jgi:hypothetical protein